MDELTREQKITLIQKQLKTLLCFSIEEGAEYMKLITYFPDEGLDAFLGFLDEVKAEQDKFFTATIKRNPDFVKEFSRFLDQTSMQIKKQFESKEKNKAEDIIKNIS